MPGNPLAAFDPRLSSAALESHQARGWLSRPRFEGEDFVLFVPRLILYVPTQALRVVFYPLRLLLGVVDKYAVVGHVEDLLYNDARTMGVMPTAAFESGYGFSAGARIFHTDLLGHGEKIALAARFGGPFQQAYQLSFEADRLAGSWTWLESRVRYERRPAQLFYGIGDPAALPAQFNPMLLIGPRQAQVTTRFQQERLLALLRTGITLGRPGQMVKVGVSAIFNHRDFGPEEVDFDEPSIEEVYDTRKIPGFEGKLNLVEFNGNLVVDFRDVKGRTSSGFYLEAFGGATLPIDGYGGYGHYGAEMALFVDLYRRTRVLQLRVMLEGTTGAEASIPFVELPRLGGSVRLRGYVEDRFRDRLAFLSALQYRYPVHQYVSAELFVELGKVAPDYEDLFGNGDRWRWGFGGGLVIHTMESVMMRLGLGYGDGLAIYFSVGPLHAFKDRGRQL